ncbi:helix-turn-helix transcriptional regulator [Streptomyces sp. NPDC087440]|uniref:helix-turn-helix transcriptional regulator n=1 Tax=Streptomyces sp. NPDC087440 TaxID=3365790 RepID=UPI0038138D20
MNPEQRPALTVLTGKDQIDAALDHAAAQAHTEVLTIQPGGARKAKTLADALVRAEPTIERNARIRTLYQHSIRYSYGVYAYAERLPAHCEIRTVEQRVDRMMIFDDTAAFIPASPGPEMALHIHHPALIRYFTEVFEHHWQYAVPLTEPLPHHTTDLRRTIARLLIEGNTDEAIAHRLGLNIRTCRAHIAKLATSLGGTTNRAQLGYLIATSGILDA